MKFKKEEISFMTFYLPKTRVLITKYNKVIQLKDELKDLLATLSDEEIYEILVSIFGNQISRFEDFIVERE
ncbi:hypothetical protein ELD05_00425 [Caldicellulosiruptor changbaiensis]|uniref:Uncharacterized protein n=1 Tax=Caldicellulosiruptor changbaiensis TaxID=1222016 RepID=A0A3T0D2L4_9FIRM|nr:hypothetical protein [Caldicellulosiruptor changbaiensis]AZT89269.1 hypothetical protein ELD05_00425 [Caldicellulosiruptor changbaiensis]